MRNIGIAPVFTYPTRFFDGAAANQTGGVGIYLMINQTHYLYIMLGCGQSNTRAELLDLWALMYFSKEIGLPMLRIYGDSSIIINWEKGISTLTTLDLEAWCENIKEIFALFSSIDYQHVYREYNERAYILSKEVLQLETCVLSFTKYYKELVIGEDSIHLF